MIGIGAFLIIWEIIAASGSIPENYLPAFYRIVATMIDGDIGPIIITESLITLLRALTGYLISASIAIPLGIFLGRSRLGSEILGPLIEFLRPLPSSAIIPVALLFLGLGSKMIIFVVVFGASWPILVASMQGAKHVDPVMMDVARLLKLSQTRVNLEVVLPARLCHL